MIQAQQPERGWVEETSRSTYLKEDFPSLKAASALKPNEPA